MKSIYTALIALSFFNTTASSEESLSYQASEIVSVQGKTGNWLIAGDMQVKVFGNEAKNIFTVSVPGVVEYTLREFCFVSEVVVSTDKSVVIMGISRWRAEGIGSYYESILRLAVDETSRSASITECLTADYMRPFYNGRTSVRSIGDVSNYPIVELEIGKALSRELPTRIEYVWELWDLEKRLPVNGAKNGAPINTHRRVKIRPQKDEQ